ncbi:LLM class flavin-dependent oxidoreductase [Streptomyces sp. NBC_00391]|uniref:LLM class flavin-dependent oxidoreductase n=1 Tax=Streptomyces sp. NBC_00391 TaxID=2903647 RepID=UPI002E1A9D89
MGSAYGRGRLHLAAAIDQQAVCGVGAFVELARLAERGALDFVTVGDASGRPGPGPGPGPGPEALAVSARVAPETARIGLVPVVATTHTEPFRVRAAVATLDWVSLGRAGWWIEVSGTEDGARPFGRRRAGSGDVLWGEAGEVADVAARLGDSREGDAGIREVGTGRFVDREKVRHADFEGVEGAGLSVRGPLIVPRPPQGHPVRVVDATEEDSRGTAARYADVALLRVADPAHADTVRKELRDAAAGFGRDPDELRVLVSLRVDLGGGEYAAEPGHGGGGPRQSAHGPLYRGGPVDLAELIIAWHRAGAADGFHLVPIEPHRDLERLVNGTVALLQHRGLFRTFYPGSTLREHLGLARPAHRYAVAGGATGGATGGAS